MLRHGRPPDPCADGRARSGYRPDVRLSYAQATDGRLLHVSEVPSGLACCCVCPGCQAPVVARKGDTRIPHFGHHSGAAGRTCAGAYESMLHKLAKQMIAGRGVIGLPEVVAVHKDRRRLLRPAADFRPDVVSQEVDLDGMRADILARKGSHKLLIEVAVTHFCGPEKVARIREHGLAAIEIDLSRLPQDAAREGLEEAIIRTASRVWIYNRLAEAVVCNMRLAAERREEAFRRRREQALEQVVHVLTAAAWDPASDPTQVDEWRLGRVRQAGIGGLIGLHMAGDGCFRMAGEYWQSACLFQFVIGGTAAFGINEVIAFLRRCRMLKPPFDEPRPRGFEWAEICARSPTLLPPAAVVGEYLQALGAMGMVRRAHNGLWQPARPASISR